MIPSAKPYDAGCSWLNITRDFRKSNDSRLKVLVIYYLWLVLSFWEDVQANAWDKTIYVLY
jgi:hypothetical protein